VPPQNPEEALQKADWMLIESIITYNIYSSGKSVTINQSKKVALKSGEIYIEALDESGNAVSNAGFTVTDAVYQPVTQVTTDGQGNYIAKPIKTGTYGVSVSSIPPGYTFKNIVDTTPLELTSVNRIEHVRAIFKNLTVLPNAGEEIKAIPGGLTMHKLGFRIDSPIANLMVNLNVDDNLQVDKVLSLTRDGARIDDFQLINGKKIKITNASAGLYEALLSIRIGNTVTKDTVYTIKIDSINGISE
jgi:hypothetical protein